MRIIAGEFRRRLLKTPPDDSVTRPIPDRVKESLFSLLRGHFEGATVFDGFAGTGAIGLEAVSRGASHVVMVERDRGIAELLRHNIDTLGVQERAELVVGDALGPAAIARCPRPLTLAFLDPPYPLVRDAMSFRRVMGQLGALIDLLTDDGFAILRTPWPLRHQVGGTPTPEAAPEPLPKRSKRRKESRSSWRREAMDSSRSPRVPEPAPARGAQPEADGADADAEREAAEDTGNGADGPAATYADADLTLPNAVGTETHIYHSMAIHLYMRRRS